jgi:hypothetical protein
MEPDLVIDISDVVDVKVESYMQHVSQVTEWLPWVGRYPAPRTPEEVKEWLNQRSERLVKKLGLAPGYYEAFNITAWGTVPSLEDLKLFFPGEVFDYELAQCKLAQFR